MSGIYKTHLYTGKNGRYIFIVAGYKLIPDLNGVIDGIQRNISWFPRSFCFAVAPFCLRFLDMGAVLEHNVAETAGRAGGINIPLKALGPQKGKPSGVVNVGVGEQDRVDLAGHYRISQFFISIPVPAQGRSQ